MREATCADDANALANKVANAKMVAQLCRTAAALASPHRYVALCYMPNDFVRESLNETVAGDGASDGASAAEMTGADSPSLFGKSAAAHRTRGRSTIYSSKEQQHDAAS